MFKKIVTSIDVQGQTSTEERGTVTNVDADMASVIRRVQHLPDARVQHMEASERTLNIMYVNGAVKLYQWVPVQ